MTLARLDRETLGYGGRAVLSGVSLALAPGERVVLTNLVPAIEGMLLAPRVDEAAEGSLRAAVTGEEATP